MGVRSMQSLKSRLAGKEKQVLDYTANWGKQAAMAEYGVHCSLSFHKWLIEQTGVEHFGENPRFASLGGTSHLDILETVRKRLENYVSESKRILIEKDDRIAALEANCEMLERRMYENIGSELLEILDTLEGKPEPIAVETS